MQNASTPTRYLPLENFHIVPIQEISPNGLKWAAKECCKKYRDREEIKLTTCQNAIAKKLGFKGGMAGFQAEYVRDLKSFMIKNDLIHPADLISPRHNLAIVHLNQRQCADGLFFPGRQLPRQIFTGYCIDWPALTNPFSNINNPLHFQMDKKAILKKLAEGKDVVLDGFETPSLVVAALEATRSSMMPWHNLLGSQLMRNEAGEWIPESYEPQIYFPSDFTGDKANDLNDLLTCLKIFRNWADTVDSGWVDVIRYNDQLVFLKGENGEYDFLFPSLKNSPFEHNVFEPYLKNADIPKSNDSYHFQRWLYFEYNGWYENDQQASEKSFYSKEGLCKDYPGSTEILRDFFINERLYSPPVLTAGESKGFMPIHINKEVLFVSNLITVSEFRTFMAACPEYERYRSQTDSECWDTVNLEEDAFLPAAATWYDANAYATWIKKTRNLPVRLLTEEEYLSLAPPLTEEARLAEEDISNMGYRKLIRFYQQDGTPISGHPPYMSAKAFNGLLVRYIPEAIEWAENKNGLKFLVSHHFGEWLAPVAAAINSATHSSLCYPDASPSRARFTAHSSGKYKSMKVGFRLCYFGEG